MRGRENEAKTKHQETRKKEKDKKIKIERR